MTFDGTDQLRIGQLVRVLRADEANEHWRGSARFLESLAMYLELDEDVQMQQSEACVVEALNEHYVFVRFQNGFESDKGRLPNGWVHPSLLDEWIHPLRLDSPESQALIEADEDRRHSGCIAAWPECVDGGFNPKCCRWPKECSCERTAPLQHKLVDGGDSVVIGRTFAVDHRFAETHSVPLEDDVEDEIVIRKPESAALRAAAILQARGAKYDNDGLSTLCTTSNLWSEWHEARFPEAFGDITISDVCELMVLHKIARQMHDNGDGDHLDDLIGYASLARYAKATQR